MAKPRDRDQKVVAATRYRSAIVAHKDSYRLGAGRAHEAPDESPRYHCGGNGEMNSLIKSGNRALLHFDDRPAGVRKDAGHVVDRFSEARLSV
jgi:hypothetical protein